MDGRRTYSADEIQRSRMVETMAAELAAGPGIAFAYLHGSFGEGLPFHDVDIGVYLQSVAPEEATDRALELAERLSRRAGVPVDVRVLNEAPVSFVFHVLRGRLLVSHDDDLRADVMERTIARYLDIAPRLKHATKEAFAG